MVEYARSSRLDQPQQPRRLSVRRGVLPRTADRVGTPVSDFDYHLPAELIAQQPQRAPRPRQRVTDLPALLEPGDLLVVNDTRVYPARLLGRRDPSGGSVECLLLSRTEGDRWDVLLHPGQKMREGARAVFEGGGYCLRLEVLARHFHGRRTVRLTRRRRPGRRRGHRCDRARAAAAVHQAPRRGG